MPDPGSEAVTVVILGASGDLTRRLLFPAIHRLMALGRIPPTTRIVGYGIDQWDTAQFVDHLRQGVDQFGDGVDPLVWKAVEAGAVYVSGDLDDTGMAALDDHVHGSVLFYLALPPPLFGTAASALGTRGFGSEDSGWRRLVVEKPFGTDLTSAQALQRELVTHWREDQLFRIDHFLGKDTVQNMLVFRLANRFVEAVWNLGHIAHVQITAAETIGLEGRWRYYDHAGALRDMLQNHLMQLFALTAMEPPSVWESEVLREHKVEVLRSVRAMAPADVAQRAVRGQYTAGTTVGETAVGYLDEPDIPPTSTTETYAALQLFVDNWRWQGVPFSIRSGKRMAGALTEIALQLRPPPARLFAGDAALQTNWIVLRLRPDEHIEIDATAKRPGLGMATDHVTLSTTDRVATGGEYSAYEQLLLDVLAGDHSLFIRDDEAMEAWRIVQPVLDGWATAGPPLPYAAGSDGPAPPAGWFGAGESWRPVQV